MATNRLIRFGTSTIEQVWVNDSTPDVPVSPPSSGSGSYYGGGSLLLSGSGGNSPPIPFVVGGSVQCSILVNQPGSESNAFSGGSNSNTNTNIYISGGGGYLSNSGQGTDSDGSSVVTGK